MLVESKSGILLSFTLYLINLIGIACVHQLVNIYTKHLKILFSTIIVLYYIFILLTNIKDIEARRELLQIYSEYYDIAYSGEFMELY